VSKGRNDWWSIEIKKNRERKKKVSELLINCEIRVVCKVSKYLYPVSILRMVRKSTRNSLSLPTRILEPVFLFSLEKKHAFFSWDYGCVFKLFQDLRDQKIGKLVPGKKLRNNRVQGVLNSSLPTPFSRDFLTL